MIEPACVLVGADAVADSNRVLKLLRCLGVSAIPIRVDEFLAGECALSGGSKSIRLISAWNEFSCLIREMGRNPAACRQWREHVHSAFIYAGEIGVDSDQLFSQFNDRAGEIIIGLDYGNKEWVISNKFPELCGPMTGLRMPVSQFSEEECALAVPRTELVHAYVKREYDSVPVFFAATSAIVDMDAEIGSGNFDIRCHVLSAIPIVMFVKWAFKETCWSAPETGACLVIDDPLLRPRYGFLNFESLLKAMERHRFSTNIAFIPWNWRRSDPVTVKMFKSHPERYSLSIHGSDHTGGEFGAQEVGILAAKARQALDRMSHHESRTGICHDRVMVFPQGVFSSVAMSVLKQMQFTASINTEVLCADLNHPPITIADVWDVAVMKYSNFPLFTRRYPSQGIENFAFDILLGKPCIIVVHHDAFRDDGIKLVEFVDQLNALSCTLSWQGLGDIVRNSFRQRQLSYELVEVEMYGSELQLVNNCQVLRRFLVTKREVDSSVVKDIQVGSRNISWKAVDGRLSFEVELAPGVRSMVRVIFNDYPGEVQCQETLKDKIKTMARRYLSEVRDNFSAARNV